MADKLFLYDSTLRDGSQAEDVSFSLEDKLGIAEKLDDLGIHYIEGGFPGSNPKDEAFFKEVRKLGLKRAKIAAFGATHNPRNSATNDQNLRLLLNSKAEVVTIVGKSWDVHVQKVLRVSKERNLGLISDSIKYLKPRVGEVVYDAEHFFDGYKADADYAINSLLAAKAEGASWLVLCDTNGGTLPNEIEHITAEVMAKVGGNIGIHCHNDGDTVVANSLAAVRAGARQVQGTINGIGERCGNANLISVIPNLQLKMGYSCLNKRNLKKLREVSLYVSEMANMQPNRYQPYVGDSAFAHKGGLHVDAVLKASQSYEHIEPESIGNKRRVLISDLSGKGSIVSKAKEYGLDVTSASFDPKAVVKKIKELESQGSLYEGADGSLEILMRKESGSWSKKFDVLRARAIVSISVNQNEPFTEAVVMVRTPDGEVHHKVAEGNGPVNAMDKALKAALVVYYPELKGLRLLDFKVRILDESSGTAAKIRVLMEYGDEFGNRWGTVGVSDNMIEACWQALIDSIDYRLHKKMKKTIRKISKK